MGMKIVRNDVQKGMQKYFKLLGINKKDSVEYKAKTKVGIQLINFIVNGSSGSSKVAPKDTGNLRGSGSVFVGSDMVFNTRGMFGAGTPNTSYSANISNVTIGFNTSYATWLEENTGWSPKGDPDSGPKYIEDHLKADAKTLGNMYATLIKKGTGA